ncbi:MAG: right-handed parallel beta-helix repeat-containing protein, partial [Candidatus Latescibacterota bacterium]
LKGNVVVNNNQGISLGASGCEVSHCVVENITSVGIGVGTADFVTNNFMLFHNNIFNCGGNGLSVTNSNAVDILYNSISQSGGYGIAVNQQLSTHMVKIKNNSISKGSSSAIWLTSGGAEINGNAIVCNVAGVFLSTDQVIDLRWNAWDHDPPTISPGRGPSDPGCDGLYDICYERDYAGTPTPVYQPNSGRGSCLVGVVPSLHE